MAESERLPCDLVEGDRDERAQAWKALTTLVVGCELKEHEFRVLFDPAAHKRLRSLVAAERTCCGWATWLLTRETTGSLVVVTGPAPHVTALGKEFGVDVAQHQ